MEITVLDFCMVNLLSYIGGVATGLLICCKHKDKLLVKSRSIDNLSSLRTNQQNTDVQYTIPPIMASAPPPDNKPLKITLE